MVYGGCRSAATIEKRKKKKKKKMPAVFWVVEKLLCGPLLLMLLLFLYWPEVSVFFGKFRWSPAILRRVSGDVQASLQLLFCYVFSMFYFCFWVLPACFMCFQPVLKLRRSSAFSGEFPAMLR
jgi:hypothetical protein